MIMTTDGFDLLISTGIQFWSNMTNIDPLVVWLNICFMTLLFLYACKTFCSPIIVWVYSLHCCFLSVDKLHVPANQTIPCSIILREVASSTFTKSLAWLDNGSDYELSELLASAQIIPTKGCVMIYTESSFPYLYRDSMVPW